MRKEFSGGINFSIPTKSLFQRQNSTMQLHLQEEARAKQSKKTVATVATHLAIIGRMVQLRMT